MAVPRNRTSNARKNSRRAHMAKKKKNLSVCSNCKKPVLAHKMCPFCGYYGGKSVIHEQTEK